MRDILVTKSLTLKSSHWKRLGDLSRSYGLSQDAFLAALAEGKLVVSSPDPSVSLIAPEPTADYLLSLSVGSLSQNLLRALRIWAIKRSMRDLDLPANPNFAQWRRSFFSDSHPGNPDSTANFDAIPDLHDPHCRCSITLSQWFQQEGIDEHEWRISVSQKLLISIESIDQMLDSRLFAVTRRSLAEDFKRVRQIKNR